MLTRWDLIIYGAVLTQPIAPIPLFGVAQDLSHGHFVTTLLMAMLPMIATALSYGRMASLYPAAGSDYTYVGRGLNPHLGFLAGWAMLLAYLLQPLINTIWIATALHARYLPRMPYVVAAALIAGIVTFLNLRGVRTTARANQVLLTAIFIVVASFIVLALYYLLSNQGWRGLISTEPFYNPRTYDSSLTWGATSFAALTYIGFDGVTTLAEDVHNPRRNVLLAAVLICVFTGIFGGFEVYLGQRVWPDHRTFPNLETAFMDICRVVGGPILFHSMGGIIALAAFGSALTGGVGAARLLFAMGRDNMLPRGIFAHLGSKSKTPTYNIIFTGLLTFGGAVGLNFIGNAFRHAAEVLNFGAFLAFMAVNLTVFWQFTVVRSGRHKPRIVLDTILPLFGLVFCGLIWWNLNHVAKTVGGIWFAVGLMYLGIKTRGFRKRPLMADFSQG